MSYGIRHQVYATVSDDTISRMEVFVGDLGYGSHDRSDFNDLWGNYSLREVFARFGPPDRILLHTSEEVSLPGYSLLLVYEDVGFAMMTTGGTHDDSTVCPQMGEGREVLQLDMSLVDPASGLDPVSPDWVPASSRFWEDVQEKLGLDLQDFFDKVMTAEAPCFSFAQEP